MGKEVYTEEEFEIDYREVLEALKKRPRENSAEKEACWGWFREYIGPEGYQKFSEDLIRVFRPKAYEWLQRYANTDKNVNINKFAGFSPLEEISRRTVERDKKGVQMDSLVLIKAVKEAVEEYRGINRSGESYSFISSVRQKYGQKAYQAAGKNDYKNAGILPDIPERNMPAVLNLVKRMESFREKYGDNRKRDEVLEEALSGISSHKYTKAELEAAKRMYDKLNCIGALDKPVEENSEKTLEDSIPDPNDEYGKLTEGEGLRAFFESIGKNWGKIKAATKKDSRNWIRIFMTKDILIELKLDTIPELSGEENRILEKLKPEPACGQWCPRKRWCPKKDKKSCYARYTSIPAGNEEVYLMLKPYEKTVYAELFHPGYLDRAIELSPKDLKEVYENLLKKDFNFSDGILADVMMKNKGTVSNKRKEFEIVRQELYKLCVKDIF